MNKKTIFCILPISLSLIVCTSCANNKETESNPQKESEKVIDVNENDTECQRIKSQITEERKKEKKSVEPKLESAKTLQGRWEEERIREASKINQKQKEIDIQKEKENPAAYIELKTEVVSKERLFTSKYKINGHMISRAKYGSYSPVWLKVSYFSKKNILLGTENIKLDISVSHKYETFSVKIKPVKYTDHYKCEVAGAIWEEFDI